MLLELEKQVNVRTNSSFPLTIMYAHTQTIRNKNTQIIIGPLLEFNKDVLVYYYICLLFHISMVIHCVYVHVFKV